MLMFVFSMCPQVFFFFQKIQSVLIVFSVFLVCTFMEDDREAGTESLEGRVQEEFAHAWDVVVHSGCVPGQTLLGTYCRDFHWPIRRRQFAWFSRVVFEDLMHIWQLVPRRDE